jgi:chromosome segregation ATPase
MALDKNDLKAIKQIVSEEVDSRAAKTEAYLKDYVEFAVEQSEVKMKARFDKVDQRFDKVDQRFDKVDQRFDKVDREINDLIKNDQEFLDRLSSHEKRIVCLEKKLKIKPT